MPELTEDQKIFVVKQLACYETPTEVATSFQEEYQIEIKRNHVQMYDPTKAQGKELSAKFVELFETTRENFRNRIEDLPLANKATRIKELTKLYQKAIKIKNNKSAAELLEQIAKEAGDAYTNKIKVAGGDAGDKPIQHEVSVTDSRIDALRAKSKNDSSSND